MEQVGSFWRGRESLWISYAHCGIQSDVIGTVFKDSQMLEIEIFLQAACYQLRGRKLISHWTLFYPF